jgi:4-hydroxybenzoyl-CoA thioesterase
MNDSVPPPLTERGRIFSREMRIEWGDCDPAGIVFYPRYLAFFDANTAYLFEAVGLPHAVMEQAYGVIGMPLIDVQAKFYLPSRFGDRIVIESNIVEPKRARLTVEHRIMRGGRLAVQGRESRVLVGKDHEHPNDIKLRPIPQEVIDRLVGSGV